MVNHVASRGLFSNSRNFKGFSELRDDAVMTASVHADRMAL
jgi:hypothetical protein